MRSASVRSIPAFCAAALLLGAITASAQEAAPAPAPKPDLGGAADIGIDSGELTPMGAIRAGDSNRFIPAWTGGLTGRMKGQAKGEHPADPFFDDVRWFTVTAADIDRYRVRLSAGLRELLRRYGDFEIAMYRTRRTAAAPRAVYEHSIANLTRSRLANNGLSLEGAENGIPFPVPKSGVEAMWNHILRWRGGPISRFDGVVIPKSGEKITLTRFHERVLPAYSLGLNVPGAVYYRRSRIEANPVDGSDLSLFDALDPIRQPRETWYRAPKETRIQRAPDFVYGTPDPGSAGIRTADMLDMFSGALDRFDFELQGRRSMYVPYNAYRLSSPRLDPSEFLWPAHPNPAFLRYELHRVWVVGARLKKGYRHPLPERTYYLDEDSWQIVMADHYGPDGALARYAEAHGIAFGEAPVFAPTIEVTYDFNQNRYVASGLDNADPAPDFRAQLSPDDFGVSALRATLRRSN